MVSRYFQWNEKTHSCGLAVAPYGRRGSVLECGGKSRGAGAAPLFERTKSTVGTALQSGVTATAVQDGERVQAFSMP
jgi:hypothetical protein